MDPYQQNQPNPPYPQGGQPPQPQYGQNPGGQNQAYGQGASGYPGPQQPIPSYPGGPPQAPGARPQTLNYAVYLMFAGAALGLISGTIGLIFLDQLVSAVVRETAQQADPATTEAAASFARLTLIGTFVILALIGAGLWVWMAFANRAGKSWARIVATIFGVIGIISYLWTTFSSGNLPITRVLNGLLLVVAIAALVFLWLKPSSDYFQQQSRR